MPCRCRHPNARDCNIEHCRCRLKGVPCTTDCHCTHLCQNDKTDIDGEPMSQPGSTQGSPLPEVRRLHAARPLPPPPSRSAASSPTKPTRRIYEGKEGSSSLPGSPTHGRRRLAQKLSGGFTAHVQPPKTELNGFTCPISMETMVLAALNLLAISRLPTSFISFVLCCRSIPL